MPKPTRVPDEAQQRLLDEVRVHLAERPQLPRLHKLLNPHHHLGSLKPVGERLSSVATNASGGWLAVLVFSAVAHHLRARDQWIGGSNEQRRRRLSLLTNHCRFLLLPGYATVPNWESRVLRLTLDRLSADWQAHYGHPILGVETFIDPDPFQGTFRGRSPRPTAGSNWGTPTAGAGGAGITTSSMTTSSMTNQNGSLCAP